MSVATVNILTGARRPALGLRPRRAVPGGRAPRTVGTGQAEAAGSAATRRGLRALGPRLARPLRAAAFLLLALVALLLAAPPQAQAILGLGNPSCWVVPTIFNNGPELPGGGSDFLVPQIMQWNPAASGEEFLQGMPTTPMTPVQDYTWYEQDGTRGLLWTTYAEDVNAGSSCSFTDVIGTQVAQDIFDINLGVVRGTISIKEIASNPSPFAAVYTSLSGPIQTLNDDLFQPMVPIMLVLTGFWVISKSRSGATREMWAGIGWIAISTVFVTFLLSGGVYQQVISDADNWISQANSSLTEALIIGDNGTGPCALPTTVPNAGKRESSCAIYQTLAFTPWAVGEFGGPGQNPIPSDGLKCLSGYQCDDLRIQQVDAQSYTNTEWANGLRPMPAIIGSFTLDPKANEWQAIAKQMQTQKDLQPLYNEWAGNDSSDRISIAASALLASLITAVMIVVLSTLTLTWQGVTVVLVVMLPIVASLAIHPSLQRLLRGWAEMFIKSFVLRFVFGVALALLLTLYQIILSTNLPLGIKLLMLIIIAVALWRVVREARNDAFTPNLGGDRSMYERSQGGASPARIALASAAGAATGFSEGQGAGRVTGAARGGIAGGFVGASGLGVGGAMLAATRRGASAGRRAAGGGGGAAPRPRPVPGRTVGGAAPPAPPAPGNAPAGPGGPRAGQGTATPGVVRSPGPGQGQQQPGGQGARPANPSQNRPRPTGYGQGPAGQRGSGRVGQPPPQGQGPGAQPRQGPPPQQPPPPPAPGPGEGGI